MARTIAAIFVAELVWTLLWLGGTQATIAALDLDPTARLDATGVLVGYVLYSVVVSAIAGYVCAAVKRDDAMRTVWMFAIIQLAIGIGFEVSAWDLTPVWYHLVFLALLVPATVWGGRLRVGRA